VKESLSLLTYPESRAIFEEKAAFTRAFAGRFLLEYAGEYVAAE